MIGAAETHGLLCGVICAGTKMNGQGWLDMMYVNLDVQSPPSEEQKALLMQLYDGSCWQVSRHGDDI